MSHWAHLDGHLVLLVGRCGSLVGSFSASSGPFWASSVTLGALVGRWGPLQSFGSVRCSSG